MRPVFSVPIVGNPNVTNIVRVNEVNGENLQYPPIKNPGYANVVTHGVILYHSITTDTDSFLTDADKIRILKNGIRASPC